MTTLQLFLLLMPHVINAWLWLLPPFMIVLGLIYILKRNRHD